MDHGSLVPLRAPQSSSKFAMASWAPRRVEYMKLWKSLDSEPILFPYSEVTIGDMDLSKAAEELTQAAGPKGLRGQPTTPNSAVPTKASPNPYADTQAKPGGAPAPTPTSGAGIGTAHPRPDHLQSDEHRLAHVKGVLWGASSKLADLNRKTTQGGGGISEQEAQSASKLEGLKNRMTKVSDVMESAGTKDLPQHHKDLQEHWGKNPEGRSGAVGAEMHLDSATMGKVHGHMASAQPSGPAPVETQSTLKPMPTAGGPRGRSASPMDIPPTPTTGGGAGGMTKIPAGPGEKTMVTPPKPVAQMPGQGATPPTGPQTLTPLPALGGAGGQEGATQNMRRSLELLGMMLMKATPSNHLGKSLSLINDMLSLS